MKKLLPALSLVLSAILFLATPCAYSDVIINVQETGDGHVTMNYSGTLDVSGLSSSNGLIGNSHRIMSDGIILNGFGSAGNIYSSPFSSTPGAWKTRGIQDSDSFSGDDFTIFGSSMALATADITSDVWSGSGMMQWDNTDIATLQWDLSVDRVWTLNNTAANTITLTQTAVPEPSGFVCLGVVGLVAVGFNWFKKRQQTA